MTTRLFREVVASVGFSRQRWREAVRTGNRALQAALRDVPHAGGPGTETRQHCRRTQRYVRCLAQATKGHPRFAAALRGDAIELMCSGARHHDIGKIGIPASILLKPGKLTPAEYEIVKLHTSIGRDIVNSARQLHDGPNEFLDYVWEIAYCHHEKWDGSGYPQGLSGDNIPVSARLTALADVYDALLSRRIYKDAYSHQEAIRLIAEGRAGHFDPDLTDIFLSVAHDFFAIALIGNVDRRAV
ncbi:HD-GYP domain-containing protein [Caballeronia terrestris]|nr:HD domain-containing phosphohydrolase [Caballeronia terrestris]